MSRQPADYMQLAIDKTREGIAAGQTPFGCVIVRGDDVVACEHNTVWATTDITAHAEICALRAACLQLDTIDLSGCTLYSTTEPCPMCFSAIHWARIDKVYYGASIADAAEAGFHELPVSNRTLQLLGRCSMELEEGLLREDCRALFAAWQAASGKPY